MFFCLINFFNSIFLILTGSRIEPCERHNPGNGSGTSGVPGTVSDVSTLYGEMVSQNSQSPDTHAHAHIHADTTHNDAPITISTNTHNRQQCCSPSIQEFSIAAQPFPNSTPQNFSTPPHNYSTPPPSSSHADALYFPHQKQQQVSIAGFQTAGPHAHLMSAGHTMTLPHPRSAHGRGLVHQAASHPSPKTTTAHPPLLRRGSLYMVC